MPVPHFNIKITQRSKGKSAVAGAAYQAGEKLFSEYDQKTKNYTCKKEVVYTEIMLPPNAPPEYADRATLWNSVEEIEKQWNSQLARRFVVALPREVPMEMLPQMVKEYCEEHFVSKGMCCDFAIHDPYPPGHNPHCHFMLTMRAIDENGKWLPKSRKVYDLDENGERIKLPSGRWKSHKEDTVDWNEQYHAEEWRHGWEVVQNKYLELAGSPERIDMRSYERQGLDIIHVHIVLNSLRIYEVPLLPYMDRPADTREGCKHRCTNAAMEYFKSEVMEMCHREGLYQIDLLNGSKERITEREYWAAKKGQLALDKENAAREAAGQPTKPTKFETDKAKLRRTIRQALSQATSFDEFSSLLLREGVTVKESRGRLSYLTPDRTKPITARKLGDDFDKAAVLALLTQNAHRAAEKPKAIPEYPHTQKGRLREEKAAKTIPADNTLQRMVDREAKRAEGKGVGYDRWAAKHNLKQMAATVTAYQQYGFSSPEELDEACSAAYAAMRESLTELKQVEKTLDGKKELQRQVLAYSKTRPVRDGLKQQKNAKAKAAYRQKHESDFIIADAAARYFKENGISKLPGYKALQAEIESLIQEKNSGYNDYRAKREEYRRLQTVKGNIDQILRRSEPQRRKEQSHER